jgi:hypothetical protein
MDMSTLDEVKQEISELKQKINDLDTKLTKIVEWIEQDGTKMSNHIDFVENVYENVKKPFHFLIDNVNHVLYNKNPFIEYQELE